MDKKATMYNRKSDMLLTVSKHAPHEAGESKIGPYQKIPGHPDVYVGYSWPM